MREGRLVQGGSFCWNVACSVYGKVEAGTIQRFGKTKRGVQRYRCRLCRETFTATKGTVFYGVHHEPEEVIECFALLAERSSLAAIHRTKGIKEETVLEWLRKAACHVEEIEALLLANYQVSRAQLDALWTFVGHKGEKGGTPKRRNAAPSGAGRRSIVTPACG
jgi:transposase-like protein